MTNKEAAATEGDTSELIQLINALTKLQEAHKIDDHKKMRDKLEEILHDLGGKLDDAADSAALDDNMDEDEQGEETERFAEQLNKDLPPLKQVEQLIEQLTQLSDQKPTATVKDEL